MWLLPLVTLYAVMLPTSWAAEDKTSEANAAVDAVLKLYDAGKFAEIYDAKLHGSLRQQMTRDQWITTAKGIVAKTGKVISRTSANKAHSMGVYRFVFTTQCADGKVFEDISVTQEGNEWLVVGFWIRPNLE